MVPVLNSRGKASVAVPRVKRGRPGSAHIPNRDVGSYSVPDAIVLPNVSCVRP
jgi:hypothetical protein